MPTTRVLTPDPTLSSLADLFISVQSPFGNQIQTQFSTTYNRNVAKISVIILRKLQSSLKPLKLKNSVHLIRTTQSSQCQLHYINSKKGQDSN